MASARVNISFPEDLNAELDRITGHRFKSQFVADAVREKIRRLEEDKLKNLLAEGYRAAREEGLAISHDFDVANMDIVDHDETR
jgi:metal-responsive CopG/Arc/MetJ family transcriptional regulator